MGLGPLKASRKLFASRTLLGFTSVLFVLLTVLANIGHVQAASGINQQINFQGRLLNGQGAVVPDGNYNIQFKIYQDGDGLTAGNTTGTPAGSLKWTESYLNNASQGVLVKNGFLSVQLGSITPFAGNIDWNQDTLWVSMNIGSTAPSCATFASCSPDGEMTPMKRLSANAYALNANNANMLGGLTASGFIQNTTSPQTATVNIVSGAAANVTTMQVQGPANATKSVVVIKGGATPQAGGNLLELQTSTGAVGAFFDPNGLLTAKNGSFTSNLSSAVALVAKASTGSTVDTLRTTDSSNVVQFSVGNTGNVTTIGSISGVGLSASTGLISGSGGANISGAAISLNTNSNFPTGINTGTSNGLVSIGGGSGTFSLDTTNIDISSAGAISGATGVSASGNITTTTTVQGATINATSGYQINGTAGSSTTCSGGQFLQNAIIAGGITTGGTCVAASNGVTTIGTFSATSIVNGASIVGTTLTLGVADATNVGLVSTVAQTIAGSKTFTGNSLLIKPGTDSATAFQIQPSSSAVPILSVDTTNQRLSLRSLNTTTSAFNVLHSDGSTALEIRAGGVGLNNTYVGINAGLSNTTGFSNSAYGNGALAFNTTGVSNTAYGSGALVANVNGNNNAAYGTNALGANSSGVSNVGVGTSALGSNSTGFNNTGVGSNAGKSDVDSFATLSGLNNTTILGTNAQSLLSRSVILGGQGSDAVNVGIGTASPTNTLSVSPVQYGAGGPAGSGTTASQSGVTVTGVGTTFTSAMVGSEIVFKDGSKATISAFVSATSLTVTPSQTVASQIYRIHYAGLQVTSSGNVGVGTTNPNYKLDANGDINTATQYRIGGTIICSATGCTPSAGSASYIQNGTGVQTSSNFNISGAGIAGSSFTAPSFIGNSLDATTLGGSLTLGATNATGGITLSQNTSIAAGKNLSLASGIGTFSQTFTGTSGNAATITASPASGTVNSALNVTNSGAATISNGIQVNRNGAGGTTTNGLGVVSTAGTIVNGVAVTNAGGTLTNGITFGGVIGTDIYRASGALSANGVGGITWQTNNVTRATFDTANGLYLGKGVTDPTPTGFTISGTGSSASGVTGGALALQGGNATAGNANGGNLNLTGGNGFGTGINGLVVISTPTFSTTTNDSNCFTGGALVAASCTIAASSVNNSSAVIVGFNTSAQSASLPDPSNTTAGRVVYITAANGSQDFTLIVNGGGIGNTIAMRQNTTATMIWNGADWTAAGASSSTTLQSAYDNTLQSAGGAELIVSKTGNTNGLTIRDSSISPVNGTLLSVQTASAAVLFSVNSNVTEYSTNGGAETAGGTTTTFPANTWSNVGSATVSRYITAGNFIATGQASVSVATTTAAGDGVKNSLSTSLTPNTNYNVSFAARLASGTFTDLNVFYSINGTATSVACGTTKAVTTSIWTKVNCTFAAPSTGITATNAVLVRQTGAGAARTFYVENLSVTIAADYNYATDGGVDDNTNFATNWSYSTGIGTGTVSRNTSDGNDASDSASVAITGGAANAGVRNKLSINPLTGTLYRVSAYAKVASGGFTDFKIRYSRDAGTSFVDCVDYNTQTITTTGWTQVTCYINTDTTAASNPYVYFVEGSAAARTFGVDTFSMTLTTNTTPNVQIGGGTSGGPTTLFTLDKGASAPIASNIDALLGSMYYDTTLGKLQCYEADGWGACGSSPDNVVTISPEYTNAVMHGTGIGTMTSDICSDTLNINDGSSSQPTICGTNETYNFYKWTSPQPSAQTYSIYVTYQLPSTFKSFASGQTSLMGRTDNANATVNYQVYRSDATGLTQCGSTVAVSTGSVASWQTGIASGAADPSTCSFAAGNSIVFKINSTASVNANGYVGNLGFTFSNK